MSAKLLLPATRKIAMAVDHDVINLTSKFLFLISHLKLLGARLYNAFRKIMRLLLFLASVILLSPISLSLPAMFFGAQKGLETVKALIVAILLTLINLILFASLFNEIRQFFYRNKYLSSRRYIFLFLRLRDIRNVNLSKLNLHGICLQDADLAKSDLYKTNLRQADLRRANFYKANLIESDLRGANLYQANLVHALLTNADLRGANLCEANLMAANLINVDLRGANLTKATLYLTIAPGADFTGAKMSGACIENWIIDEDTKLDRVECRYVYRKAPKHDRCPSDPSKNFAPGEFTKLFQKILNTIDLIFQDGINWQALSLSLEKLKIEAEGSELSIQAIENKRDGAFVVRVNAPSNVSKSMVETLLKKEYNLALKAIHERYQYQLQAKTEQMRFYQQQNTDLMKVLSSVVSKPIINIATSENQTMSDRIINMGSGNYNETIEGSYVQGNALNLHQNLPQAAAEIQTLLNHLQQQGVTLDVAQDQVAKSIAAEAQTNPSLMDRLAKWGQTLTEETSKKTVGDVVTGTVKLALRSAGLPLP
jgi:uncharacterized protein YjbI with pentapeptide repeats